MSFRDCINSARDQGALTPDEAEELIRRYEAHVGANRGTDHPGGAEGAAKEALAKEVSDAAARKEFLADLAAAKADEIRAYLEDYRDLATGDPDVLRAAKALLENRNNELAGVPSVVGRRDALVGWSHGELEANLYAHRRKFWSGERRNLARLDHLIDEAHGVGTGDDAAKGFLEAWRNVADTLVDRFNAAGGEIRKLDAYFPQRHDARKIVAAGEKAWTKFIRDRIDVSVMADPLTGGVLSPIRLDEALSVIYRRIVTDGAIDIKPSGQIRGRGALANQRQEERFLHFKDAGAWRDYAQAFGSTDVYAVMMDHIHGLAKDVAALEILGPNPNATVEWLKQVVESEAAKKTLNEATLFRGAAEPITASGGAETRTDQIDNLWKLVNGAASTSSALVADTFETARNVTSAVNLAGTAVTAAFGDPAQMRWASKFAGVSALRGLALMPAQMLHGASKREVVQFGIVMADALDHMTTEFRQLSWAARSREASRWLPDRVFTWTGLTPLTRGERRGNALNFMFDAGNRAEMTLAEISQDGPRGEAFARYLRGFGVDDATWDIVRSAKGFDHGEGGRALGPSDVYAMAAGDETIFEAGLRYSEAVHAFQEDAIPEGTARARAALDRFTPKGSLSGEAVRSATSYLVYPATMQMSLIRATAVEAAAGGFGRGASFLTSAMVGLTLAGAAIELSKELRAGQDMEAPTTANFWLRALVRGGGLGFFGDWLLADYQRGAGDQVAHVAGPVLGLAGDVLATVAPADWVGTVGLEGSHLNRTARAVRLAKKVVPVQNMWWLKPVTERLIWDRLQRLADPHADHAFQARANKLFKDRGTGMWWPRGQALPDRAPVMIPW